MKFELFSGGTKFDVDVTPQGDGFAVEFGGKRFAVKVERAPEGDSVLARVDNDEIMVILEDETESMLRLGVDGQSITLGRAQVQLHAGAAAEEATAPPGAEKDALPSPLYGKVVSVDVKPGDVVDTGQSLLVLEAMKMESVVRADSKHRIKEVLVKEGEGVQKGQVLMRFSPGEG
jgi:biotin carboxyl carrier protein